MPSVSYSPEQQASIDKATALVKAAENAVTAAQNNVNARYHDMENAFGAGSLSPQCYNKPSSLTSQLSIGNMNKQSCKKNILTPSNLNCPKCPDQVSAFNQAYSNWQGAKAGVDSANAALTTAKNNLTNLINSIAAINANDPAIQQANQVAVANAIAQQKKEQAKWILFGLIALVIITAALLFTKMLLTHKTTV